MTKDTSDMLGAVIVQPILGQEGIEDWPHLFTSAPTGGWEVFSEGTDDVQHDL
jgi:hypothetical protein